MRRGKRRQCKCAGFFCQCFFKAKTMDSKIINTEKQSGNINGVKCSLKSTHLFLKQRVRIFHFNGDLNFKVSWFVLIYIFLIITFFLISLSSNNSFFSYHQMHISIISTKLLSLKLISNKN